MFQVLSKISDVLVGDIFHNWGGKTYFSALIMGPKFGPKIAIKKAGFIIEEDGLKCLSKW